MAIFYLRFACLTDLDISDLIEYWPHAMLMSYEDDDSEIYNSGVSSIKLKPLLIGVTFPTVKYYE